MSVIQWKHAANSKWFWLELDSKHDLIRTLNIFPGHNFLVKTVIKTPKMQKNNIIYQPVSTHILMSMMQWKHVSYLKWFWWELHRKLDLIRNLNIFFSGQIFLSKVTEKTPQNTNNHKIDQLETCTYW